MKHSEQGGQRRSAAHSQRGPNPYRQFWDGMYRYTNQQGQPSALLQRWLERLPPGRAMDIACGAGRNTLLLAEFGWRVLGVDISPVALQLVRDQARQRGLSVELLAADLDVWPLPVAAFDLVCVFRYLDRALCPHLMTALKPGGVLVYETFTIEQRHYEGGPPSTAMMLQPGELLALFPSLEVLEHTEGVIEEDGKPRALGGLVARRPAGG